MTKCLVVACVSVALSVTGAIIVGISRNRVLKSASREYVALQPKSVLASVVSCDDNGDCVIKFEHKGRLFALPYTETHPLLIKLAKTTKQLPVTVVPLPDGSFDLSRCRGFRSKRGY